MYDIITKQDYFKAIISSCNQAGPGSRILLMTMTYEPDEPIIAEISEAMIAAASRGADVTLAVDARSFLTDHTTLLPGPLVGRLQIPQRLIGIYAQKMAFLNRLNVVSPGSARIINLPRNRWQLPIAGRSHIKIFIHDDEVIISGCNLDEPDNRDIGLAWNDLTDADKLYDSLLPGIRNGDIKRSYDGLDQRLQLSRNSDVLIDAGVPGQSAILQQALQLIDTAKKWLVITCQFFPNSVTARHLAAARQRGVKVTIYYSHFSNHGLVGGSIQFISQLLERGLRPTDMFKDGRHAGEPMIHAKLLASDAGVLIGSHNYVSAGVELGTAEIAIFNRDERLAQHCRDAFTTQL